MFDGDLSTGLGTAGGSTSTYTPSTPLGSSELKFFGSFSSGSGTITFNWDGGSYTYPTNVNNEWIDVTSNVTFPITSIVMEGGDIGLEVRALEVDGKILIDGCAEVEHQPGLE